MTARSEHSLGPDKLFPLAYAHWYAARLFLDAGHPATEVLRRLDIDTEGWRACHERYAQLHFASTSWVASAYRRDGLQPPEQDRGLFEHLTATGLNRRPVAEPFSMRDEVVRLRHTVEANPRIGPFADVAWIAHYLGERRMPTIRYVHDGVHVRVDGAPICDRKGIPLAGVDPFSFRQLGERWFRDDKRVYGQGETQTTLFWFVARNADPDSFTVLNERYATDKAAGYYITNLRLPTEDPGTFEVIGYDYGHRPTSRFHIERSDYARDSRKVYAFGVTIEGADPSTFQAIGDEGLYFADKGQIYFRNQPIPDVDRASFTCASEAGQYLAYDKDRPYWAGKAQSISAAFEPWRTYFEVRPKLDGTWWHREKVRQDAGQTKTVKPRPLGGPFFSDGHRVLITPRRPDDGEWVSLDHFDHASFRPIVDGFGQDRHGLRYFLPGLEAYGQEPVKGGDPVSFEAVAEGWFKDSRQAYYLDSAAPMPALAVVKADLKSFEVLGGAYARDAKGLIVEGKRKRDIADPGAVVALGHAFARMGQVLLYRGKPVARPGKVDGVTARGVHDEVLIDAKGHLLIGGRYRKPVPGLDPATFRFLNRRFAVDNDHVYALTDDALLVCHEVDRASISADGGYAVRDRHARFHVSGSSVYRTPLAEDQGSTSTL
ncbi:hypothetical protein J2855_002783 [Agrobacterium tumefaciens]|uniref:DKNYY domain-containing protein n=1 Tax=Agrobacterium tumefaciens TaxID=358 RepID=UPI001D6173FB|nr:DKNYY domain-containing protein [Agrobacterium tumefaciens]MBP2509137.1 hypothetical protein [Agrobacterium tumefaciens]MBP2518290.1 hypothetical protein [Agrobacterium tumefaciens]MBP2576923.1 hypothetical protein [Agrobacterium tumefaciens]MBP2594896.1 hypothetical protein [Agrobacterium tumefaciens]